jgi:pilus assembly protein CpaF
MSLLKRLSVPQKSEIPIQKSELKKTNSRDFSSIINVESNYEMKEKIHRQLVDKLDLASLDTIPKHELKRQVKEVVEVLLLGENELPIGFSRDGLVEDILNEVFGLGPLEPLIHDPTISDILVNTYNQVYVERFGKLEPTNTIFKDDNHLKRIIDRIVSQVGRRVDESNPMVDARLQDGSRVNAVIPPLAIDGPMLSIRKFTKQKLSVEDLFELDTLTPEMGELLKGVVKARLNVLISGGTGSGKTTLLNVLSGFIPSSERIITIEDAAELQLQQEHVIRLETRPPNVENKGTIVQRDLVRNALRMRPDRIIVGEVRGAEALDMLQAMNTGHDGSMTTLHANTTRDGLRRLETMILMDGTNLPDKAMREQISSSIQVLVHVSRQSDGSRKVVRISEITGMESDVISLQDIYIYEKYGIREDGQILGAFRATGVRPKFAEILRASGIDLKAEMFEEGLLASKEYNQQ